MYKVSLPGGYLMTYVENVVVPTRKSLITIVLPLLDREIYTPIWIRENLFDDFDYIIADGSKTDANQILFGALSDRPNVKYIRYPVDACIVDYVKKMNDAISQVETPYVMTCDNDDFLSYKGIVDCINALKENESCGFANGKVRNVTGLAEKPDSPKRFYRLRPDGVVVDNLNGMAGIEAIKHLFRPYKYVWYGVYRTELLIKIWREILLSKLENFFLIEFLQGQLAFCFSKMVFIDRTHYIRLTNPISNAAKQYTPDEYPSQHGIYFDDKYRAEVLKMGEIVADTLKVDKRDIYAIYRAYYSNQYSYFVQTSLKMQLKNALYNRIHAAISFPLSICLIRKIA